MTTAYQDLTYAVDDDGICRIALDRPRYRNAQSRRLVEELDHAFARAGDDDAVRVVVLAAAGDAFSAGHDLGSPDDREEVRRRREAATVEQHGRSWRLYSETALRWRDVPKPTIAAVQGPCLYAGWAVASAMDLVIASQDARFLPHLSEYFSLPWIVGGRRAKQLLFTNQLLDADAAFALGMVNEVVPRKALEARAGELARQIAAGHPQLLRLIKAAVNGVEDGQGFHAAIRTAQAYNVLAYNDPRSGLMSVRDDGREDVSPVAAAVRAGGGQPR